MINGAQVIQYLRLGCRDLEGFWSWHWRRARSRDVLRETCYQRQQSGYWSVGGSREQPMIVHLADVGRKPLYDIISYNAHPKDGTLRTEMNIGKMNFQLSCPTSYLCGYNGNDFREWWKKLKGKGNSFEIRTKNSLMILSCLFVLNSYILSWNN